MDEVELDDLREHYDASMVLVRSWGLEPYEVDFHVCPADRIYEVASYGVPGHFSHWTYGRDFWIQKMQYDHGISKIYELVINANPAQAFLLDVNSTLENMFVISHVLGHSDFFANNVYFSRTNQAIEHTSAAAAERFSQYEFQHGRRQVEEFIDDVLTIRHHINIHPRIRLRDIDYEQAWETDAYDDLFPVDNDRELQQERDRVGRARRTSTSTTDPEEDVLLYLIENSRFLVEWERDVLRTIRDEEQYFLPQMQTKIMNEGWASLIHRTVMHHLDPEVDPGGIEFASMHSGVLNDRPGPINPYWLGYNVFLRIIEKYGEHTPEEMQSMQYIGGAGWKKALEVRELDTDESFIRNYLDRELVERLDLFTFGYQEKGENWVVQENQEEWEAVRDGFVASRTELARPHIVVDPKSRHTLILRHIWDGRPLQRKYAIETLKSIYRLWGESVFLYTNTADALLLFECSGDEVTISELE